MIVLLRQHKSKNNLLPYPLTVGESPMSNENPVTWLANHKSILAVRFGPHLWSNLMRIFPVNEWEQRQRSQFCYMQHYHIVFTSPAIIYRIYARSFIFICGLKYLKVDILRARSASFLIGEEPVRRPERKNPIALKFKVRWFPDEASYRAEKL